MQIGFVSILNLSGVKRFFPAYCEDINYEQYVRENLKLLRHGVSSE